ncbi:hypothetical protein Pmani_028509 [Petrolisthes manimaculis]|uniref:Uncharacterized protein n=1 Tax=Petrolisthes manimaculis TaxID=1843537 RepID=A0AAE1P132_9EUCA|nr:hypothetical protein Pmani_028509 [Petrolisthes manimaculis]
MRYLGWSVVVLWWCVAAVLSQGYVMIPKVPDGPVSMLAPGNTTPAGPPSTPATPPQVFTTTVPPLSIPLHLLLSPIPLHLLRSPRPLPSPAPLLNLRYRRSSQRRSTTHETKTNNDNLGGLLTLDGTLIRTMALPSFKNKLKRNTREEVPETHRTPKPFFLHRHRTSTDHHRTFPTKENERQNILRKKNRAWHTTEAFTVPTTTTNTNTNNTTTTTTSTAHLLVRKRRDFFKLFRENAKINDAATILATIIGYMAEQAGLILDDGTIIGNIKALYELGNSTWEIMSEKCNIPKIWPLTYFIPKECNRK